jgi:hypothetical protein
VSTYFGGSSTYGSSVFEKKSKSQILGGISMFIKLIVFGQILAKFATLAVAESMPRARLKSLKPSNSSIMNPNATWSSSLESYHLYLMPQKVSKNLKIYYNNNSMLENAKSHFGFLKTLGINIQRHCTYQKT